MIMLPFPLIVAEIVIFVLFVQRLGFFPAVGLYLVPCLLGMLIVSTVGRMALMSMQGSLTQGKVPGARLLHSGAIFLSGLFFLIPSFFSRIAGLILLLPGLRHLAVWRFKLYMAQKIAKGGAFSFGNGFGFSTGFGNGGFQYRQYGGGPTQGPGFERDVTNNNAAIDVTPLKVTHEPKRSDDGEQE